MSPSLTVTVGGLIFRNGPSPDGDVSRVLSRIDGWHGGVGVRAEVTARPTAHGAFAERGQRDGRLVTLEGYSVCRTRAAAAAEASALAALLADGGFDALVVTDVDQGTLEAQVRLGAAPVIEWWDRDAVRWSLPLYAPDPLRYGPLASVSTGFPELVGGLRYPLYTDGAGTTLGWLDYGEPSTSGTVTLSNPGTAATHPQFEVTGPAQGFEIIEVGTGRRLVYDDRVPPGSHLVIDTASGVAVMDGVSDRTLMWQDPMAIPPGETVEFAFVPRGEWSPAALRASARPAYW